jgi:hypothetical protein
MTGAAVPTPIRSRFGALSKSFLKKVLHGLP